MNELNNLTVTHITVNSGKINNTDITGGFIADTHITPASLHIEDNTIVSIGDLNFTGSDIRELVLIKDLLKQMVQERFPHHYI